MEQFDFLKDVVANINDPVESSSAPMGEDEKEETKPTRSSRRAKSNKAAAAPKEDEADME